MGIAMMNVNDIMADKTLTTMLDKVVKVKTSAGERLVRAYADNELPQGVSADEFIVVSNNGYIKSLTKPIGFLQGYLALTIYCKSNSDGTAKRRRINAMLEQVMLAVNERTKDGIYYEINLAEMITPPTVNLTNGYAVCVLSAKWRNQASK